MFIYYEVASFVAILLA